MVRVALVSAWLTLLLGMVGGLFWYYDWVYQLPTPIPQNYHAIARGTRVDLGEQFTFSDNKPVFLHFYNPDCPCSRFNKTHFQSLVRNYGSDVHFAVVVMSDKTFTKEYIQDKIGLELPVFFDQSIADRCGVYSTPQAAVIDNRQQLYYRGNYNASRYCTDEKTAYAQLALAGLLQSEAHPVFDEKALKAYGCSIPICKN